MQNTESSEVLVIGGGVIGVCSAYYIAAAGGTVTLVDQERICAGCSAGNAGLIVPSHSIPLAAPGVLGKAVRWMFDPDSPFYIKPRLDLDLLLWLWRFAKHCGNKAARRAIPLIRDLTRASARLYQELARIEGFNFGYQKRGLLVLFDSSSGYREGRNQARLLQEFEIESQELSPVSARQLASIIEPNIAGGIYYPEDSQLIPTDFVQGLANKAQCMGVKIYPSTRVQSFNWTGERITAVNTTRGEFRPAIVVLASGAWSSVLLRALQVKLPLQAAKGYSVTVATPPNINLEAPLLLHESKVAVTPMGTALRVAGTLELTGLDASINRRRVDSLLRSSKNYLSGLENLKPFETWAGLRPCSPDGLPVIGRLKEFKNLFIATGHAMLGLTLGPITGKLVSQLVRNESLSFETQVLSPARFM